MDRIFIFLLCFYFCSAKIKITNLDVPPAILYGSADDVVLDCDFDSGGDNVTELKWFLNGNKLIYQWLPNENKGGQPNPNFKKHIDVNYKVTKNGRTMYRALHITNLTRNFTGNYTCKVSSINSEDEETKRMIIYVIPDDIDDNDDDDDIIDDDDDVLEITISKETKEITCSASGFFPEPNLTLYITNDNNTEIIFRQDDEMLELTDEEFYNVTSTLQFEDQNSSQTYKYFCELNIPGTPYNISEEGTFSLEDDTEIQRIEDYLDSLNSTESTESSFEEGKDVETQIEEELDIVPTTTEAGTIVDVKTEEKNLNENSSLKQLPSLLPTAVMVLLLSLLNF